MSLSILHLSDLHIKSNNTPQDLVFSSLIKKITELGKSHFIKALIVTGDIAFSGKQSEYDKAKEIFGKIIGICKIDIRNVFFIPGNHDVDRSKIKPGQIDWWYKFEDESALQLILDSDDALPKIQCTKDSYYAFAQEFMNKNIVYGKFGQYVHDLFIEENDTPKIKIAGLNSALFCGYDGDDQGKLALGLEQAAYCEDRVDSNKEIVITCIHHPFICLHSCEIATINVIKRFSDVILSGHMHRERNSCVKEGNFGERVMIGAGASFEKRSFNNSFNLIEIDLQQLSGHCNFYKYLPLEHIWIVNRDINYQTEGIFNFSFAKQRTIANILSDPASAPPKQQNRYSYQLTLNSELESLSRTNFDDILALLRQSTGDEKLQITEIVKGSIKITFQTIKNNIEEIRVQLTSAFNGRVLNFTRIQVDDQTYSINSTERSVLHWRIKLKSDYFDQLISIGANFIHPRVEELTLEDLFVFPNLKRVKTETDIEERRERVLKSEDVISKKLSEEMKVVIYGSESSGKTTLLKKLFLKFYSKGFIPIILPGNHIRDISEKKIKKLLQQELLRQYEKVNSMAIDEYDPDRIIVMIDDFHRVRFSQPKFKAILISNLLKITKNVIITANDLMQLETYTSKSGKSQNILEGFDRFSLLEFGPMERYNIIKKWNGLGKIESDPNDVIRFNNDTEDYVETIIGKNYVPSFPIYLITILQAKDATLSQKPEYSLHGFYYELLINEALNKAVKNKEEISLFYNYITDYCYFLFITEIRDEPVSIEDLYKFHDNYCREYDISVNLNIVLNTLINSKLLKLTQDDKFISVPYKYIYYFFSAKYLSNNISNAETKAIVKSLCQRVYRDEYSSIVMFLTHLSKDQFIIDELLQLSKELFVEFTPTKLEKDVLFINEMVDRLPANVYEPIDIDRLREEELKQIEELDRQEKEFDPNKDIYQYALNENIETLDGLSKMIKAVKTLEITGQVTKKYWGSLKAPQKLELAEETYMLGFRTLAFYFSMLEGDTDMLVEYLNSMFKKRNINKSYSKEQIDKASRNYLFNLCVKASVGIIKQISNAIGYQKLAGTLEQVRELHNTNSVNLVDASIKLDHNKSFPWKEINDLNNDTKDHFLSKTILQNLVINYLYVFHTSTEEKQKICAKLGIQMEQQLLIDAISTIKKESN